MGLQVRTETRVVNLPNGETTVEVRTWTEYVYDPNTDGPNEDAYNRAHESQNAQLRQKQDVYFDRDEDGRLSTGDIQVLGGDYSVFGGDGPLSVADAEAMVASAYHVCTLKGWDAPSREAYLDAVRVAVSAYEAEDPENPQLARLRTQLQDIRLDVALLDPEQMEQATLPPMDGLSDQEQQALRVAVASENSLRTAAALAGIPPERIPAVLDAVLPTALAGYQAQAPEGIAPATFEELLAVGQTLAAAAREDKVNPAEWMGYAPDASLTVDEFQTLLQRSSASAFQAAAALQPEHQALIQANVTAATVAGQGAEVTHYGYTGSAEQYGREAVMLETLPPELKAQVDKFTYLMRFAEDPNNAGGQWSVHALSGQPGEASNYFVRYTAPSGLYSETSVLHGIIPEAVPAQLNPETQLAATALETAGNAVNHAKNLVLLARASGDPEFLAAAQAAETEANRAYSGAQAMLEGGQLEVYDAALTAATASIAAAETEGERFIAALTRGQEVLGRALASANGDTSVTPPSDEEVSQALAALGEAYPEGANQIDLVQEVVDGLTALSPEGGAGAEDVVTGAQDQALAEAGRVVDNAAATPAEVSTALGGLLNAYPDLSAASAEVNRLVEALILRQLPGLPAGAERTMARALSLAERDRQVSLGNPGATAPTEEELLSVQRDLSTVFGDVANAPEQVRALMSDIDERVEAFEAPREEALATAREVVELGQGANPAAEVVDDALFGLFSAYPNFTAAPAEAQALAEQLVMLTAPTLPAGGEKAVVRALAAAAQAAYAAEGTPGATAPSAEEIAQRLEDLSTLYSDLATAPLVIQELVQDLERLELSTAPSAEEAVANGQQVLSMADDDRATIDEVCNALAELYAAYPDMAEAPADVRRTVEGLLQSQLGPLPEGAALETPAAEAAAVLGQALAVERMAYANNDFDALAHAQAAITGAKQALGFALEPSSGLGQQVEATDEFRAILDQVERHLTSAGRALELPEGALEGTDLTAEEREAILAEAQAVSDGPGASSAEYFDALTSLFRAYPDPAGRPTELMLQLVDQYEEASLAEFQVSATDTATRQAVHASMDELRELVRTGTLSDVLGITGAEAPGTEASLQDQADAVAFATQVLTHPDATLRDVLAAQSALIQVFPAGSANFPTELALALQLRGEEQAVDHANLLFENPNVSLEELQDEVMGFFQLFPDPSQRSPQVVAAFDRLVDRIVEVGTATLPAAELATATQDAALLKEQFRTQSMEEMLHPPLTENEQAVADAYALQQQLLVGAQNISDPNVMFGYAEANAEGLFAPTFLEFQAVGIIPDTIPGADLHSFLGVQLGIEPAGTGDQMYPPGSPERHELDKIAEQITEIGGPSPELVVVPVMYNSEQTGPMAMQVFGVKNPVTGNYEYVDNQGRTYKTWADWKANNHLPPGRMYYPPNGAEGTPACPRVGEERALDTPGFEPASTPKTVDTFGERAVKVLDPLVMVGSIIVGGTFMVAGVLGTPLTGGLSLGLTVAGAGMAAYGVGRAGSNLYDMAQHGGIEWDEGQGLELNDPMAIPEMFNLVTSGLGVFAFAKSAQLLRLGRPMALPSGLTGAMMATDAATAATDFAYLANNWNTLSRDEKLYLAMQGTFALGSVGFSGYQARMSFRARTAGMGAAMSADGASGTPPAGLLGESGSPTPNAGLLPDGGSPSPGAGLAAADGGSPGGAILLGDGTGGVPAGAVVEGEILLGGGNGVLDLPSSSLLDAPGGRPADLPEGSAPHGAAGDASHSAGVPPQVDGGGVPPNAGAADGTAASSFDWRQAWENMKTRGASAFNQTMDWASAEFKARFGNIDWTAYARRFEGFATRTGEGVRTRMGTIDWRAKVDEWFRRTFSSPPAVSSAAAAPDPVAQRWSNMSDVERARFDQLAGDFGGSGASPQQRLSALTQELGLGPNATWADVKASYRRLARELHPDANPNPTADATFKRVDAAYKALDVYYNGYSPATAGVRTDFNPDERFATPDERFEFERASWPWSDLPLEERPLQAFKTVFPDGSPESVTMAEFVAEYARQLGNAQATQNWDLVARLQAAANTVGQVN